MNLLTRLTWTLCLPLSTLFSSVDDPFPKSSRHLASEAYSRRPSQENWLFSPLSASACLSMVYAGSDQMTALELKNGLNLMLSPEEAGPNFKSFVQDLLHSSTGERDFNLHIAQGMWSQRGFPFLESFISSMQNDFSAEIESIDFTPHSVDRINAWVASQTEQKIQNLLSPLDIDSRTKLVLANALYFKGCWQTPFSPKQTGIASFTKQNGEIETAFMMRQASRFSYYEDEELQAVLLPFAKSASAEASPACLLILSKKPSTPVTLSAQKIDQILGSLSVYTVNLEVPRFTFEQKLDLNSLLLQLGVRDAFTNLADFSKMDGRADLCLSKVVQKCFFSFDENGVEAAAATAAVMNTTTCITPSPELIASFIANRPFEIVLVDSNSRTCLMIGHVEDPM